MIKTYNQYALIEAVAKACGIPLHDSGESDPAKFFECTSFTLTQEADELARITVTYVTNLEDTAEVEQVTRRFVELKEDDK